jgi:pimeloyl-ACP methyl ester carboxylesterase
MSRARKLFIFGGAAAAVAAAAAYRRATANARPPTEDELASLGWGDIEALTAHSVTTTDGATLATWDVGTGPTVVLPHCWGCSHAVWVPVARRLVEAGHRVVLYDQRGHGDSTRGTSQLTIELLGDDLAAVMAARDVHDAVLAGHSMGGMTIMSLATHHPEVLKAEARAIVLVATAATNAASGPVQAQQFAAALMGSPAVARVLRSSNGHRFVRGAFGTEALRAQVDLTRTLFADCDPPVRAGYLTAMSTMNLLEGIATIAMPTTVVVGSKDRLTPPSRARQMVATIPGARLVTLEGRGHMLPLEDPDTVTDEIIRAVKG